MHITKYLNKLNWKFKKENDELYYLFHKGIKISTFGVDKTYPDEGLILLKSTIKEVQDIKRMGLLGLWWQIKSKLNMVDNRLNSLNSSYRATLERIQGSTTYFKEMTSILSYYDELESIENTMILNRNIKIKLMNEFREIFIEEPLI